MTTPKRDILPETMYGLGIASRAAVGGLLGYGAQKVAEGLGYVLDRFHNVVIPQSAKADQQVGKVIVEHGGDVGKAVIAVDKAQGDIWSRIFGRTPEEQKEWRERHGLEEPSYLGKTEEGTTVTVEMAPRTIPEPTRYQEQFNTMTDPLVIGGMLAGAAYGLLKGGTSYIERRATRRRNKDLYR